MSLLKSLSFPGQKIVALTEDAVAYVSGNGVCVLSLSTNAMSFVTPSATLAADGTNTATDFLGGVSALAASGTTQQLAIAPRSLSPTIDLYDYPSLEKVGSLTGGATLDYADIAFSANGARVAAISKLPDFTLVVWDVKTGTVVCRATLAEPCTSVSFNPLKEDQLCVSGEKGLFMWSIKTTVKGDSQLSSIKLKIKAVDDEEESGSGDEQEDPEDDEDFEEAQGPRNDFVCHCWNVHGQVHAATRAGEAFTVTATGAVMLETFPEFYASSGMDTGPPADDEPRLVARSLFPTKAHIVCVHSDGKVRWLTPHSFEIQRVVDLSSYRQHSDENARRVENTSELQLEGSSSPWVVPVNSTVTPGFMTLVVGTADGLVLSLTTGQDEIADVEDYDGETFLEGKH